MCEFTVVAVVAVVTVSYGVTVLRCQATVVEECRFSVYTQCGSFLSLLKHRLSSMDLYLDYVAGVGGGEDVRGKVGRPPGALARLHGGDRGGGLGELQACRLHRRLVLDDGGRFLGMDHIVDLAVILLLRDLRVDRRDHLVLLLDDHGRLQLRLRADLSEGLTRHHDRLVQVDALLLERLPHPRLVAVQLELGLVAHSEGVDAFLEELQLLPRPLVRVDLTLQVFELQGEGVRGEVVKGRVGERVNGIKKKEKRTV